METINHKFFDSAIIDVDCDEGSGCSFITTFKDMIYLEKADTIAIAKAQGITAEDLEG